MSQLDTPGNQTLALAGVFQSVHLCKSLATTGMCRQDELDATLGSILTVDTDRVIDAYGGSTEALKPGLRVLSNQLGGRGEVRDLDIARYTLLLVQLGSNVMRDTSTIEQLKTGIERAQSLEFAVSDPTLVSNLANLYRSAISHLSPRIMVSGDARHLNNTETASKIRAVLLGGLRSVVLWRQCGGSRMNLLLARGRYVRTAKEILDA